MSQTGAMPMRTSEVLSAFALAGDLGRGQPSGHVFRTAIIAMYLAKVLHVSREDEVAVFYTALLLHAGCTAGSPQFAAFLASDDLVAQRELCLCDPSSSIDLLRWMRRNIAPGAPLPERLGRALHLMAHEAEFSAEFDGGCSDVGARIAGRLNMPGAVSGALFHVCETWNGRGPHKLRGPGIPLATRIVNAAMVIEILLSAHGQAQMESTVRSRRGKSLDPQVVDAFSTLATDGALWDALSAPDPRPIALALEPESPVRFLGDEYVDDVCLAFADFADFKAAHTAARSRNVADLAEAVAARMGLAPADRALARRAGLVHDVGLVAVPSYLLAKQPPLSPAEEERYRTHPYYTAYVLSKVSVLEDVARIAAFHHERMDGRGYHQGLLGADIPVAARAVATAVAFFEMSDTGGGRPFRPVGAVLEALRRDDPRRCDSECVAALADVVARGHPRQELRGVYPAGLTEREVEVIALATTGLTVKDMAMRLIVSEATVRHHLEHIYAKIGVSSRAGAVLFAVENGLTPAREVEEQG